MPVAEIQGTYSNWANTFRASVHTTVTDILLAKANHMPSLTLMEKNEYVLYIVVGDKKREIAKQ